MPEDKENKDWNFITFEKYVDQRFMDLRAHLEERYESQQTGLLAALAAAEKAVNTALVAAEKAVDKAEGAQQLRNEAQNEFRKSLSDLSGLMWTIKEGTQVVESLRREVSQSIITVETRITALSAARTEALELTKTSLEGRLNIVENGYSNLQGRIWAVGALFAILTVALTVGVRFIH